jgi:hypothetical protein
LEAELRQRRLSQKGTQKKAETRLEIASIDIPGKTETCTGEEAYIEDSEAEESGPTLVGNRRECATSTTHFAHPSKTSEERSAANDVFKQESAPSGGKDNGLARVPSALLDISELVEADNPPPMSTVVITCGC